MIARYYTENSIYEVREEDNLIRRVSGSDSATERFGGSDGDGQWRSYRILDMNEHGLIIVWAFDGGTARMTVTSPVERIESADS